MLDLAPGSALDVAAVSKSFRDARHEIRALEDVSFSVARGAFVSVVGPSGCGKSTLLRLIAGLEAPDGGDILIDRVPVRGPSLRRGIVFQEHRLFPWLTVEANVGLGLLKASLPAAEKREAARALIASVGLSGFEQAFPSQLSGGMAQRAAIARSLAARPEILLLDEPFGALDSLTRGRMQKELLHIWRHESVTMLLVTHDVAEAVFLSDRIVVMDRRPGRVRTILDVDSPHPGSRRDARFTALTEELIDLLEDARD